MQDRVTLKIPRPLYEKLHHIIADSGYRSVNEFVVHVLRDLVADRVTDQPGALSAREVVLIRQRLRNLGYLVEERTTVANAE
jgi:metal-responsive CopG/Arc/MetJ family transcriptional regulator